LIAIDCRDPNQEEALRYQLVEGAGQYDDGNCVCIRNSEVIFALLLVNGACDAEWSTSKCEGVPLISEEHASEQAIVENVHKGALLDYTVSAVD
jgi:hypothetical protein